VNKKLNKPKAKLLGFVDVDSSMLLVCDPCYIDSSWLKWKDNDVYNEVKKGSFSYHGCCIATKSKKHGGPLQHAYWMKKNYNVDTAGVGVVFNTRDGDGCYPVFAIYDDEGSIKSVIIDFSYEVEETIYEKVEND